VGSAYRRQAVLSVGLVLVFYGKSTVVEWSLSRRFSDYESYSVGTLRFVPRVAHR